MQIIKIHQLNHSELDEITSLHYQVIHESVLNKLGKGFLKIIYRAIPIEPYNILLVAREQNQIIGYLVATKNSQKFYRQIIRKNFLPLIKETSQAVFQPVLLFFIVVWFFSSKKDPIPAQLQFIAVKPKYQNQGIGTKLIKQLAIEFKQVGIKRFKVGTKTSNQLSNEFYKKKGFRYLNQQKLLGDQLNFYLSPKITSE